MTAATSVPPPRTGPSNTWRYRPELDGLRTFAVVVIVFFHARVGGASSSFIVLDLFFVLSGFLVTNVVLSEVDSTGELRLGRYYARRVRRLLPAAVVTILVTSVVFVMVASQPERLEFVRQAQAALLYLANWQFIADGADYFAGDIRNSPFMHFWSLSIEEQYYIAFPLVLLAWWKWAPQRGRVLLVALLGLGLLSVASQLYWAQVDPTRAYFATDARLFQLLAGAALAVALREFATPSPEGGVEWVRGGRALAFGGLAGYAIFGTELVDMTVSNRNLVATVIAGALVVGLYTAPGSLVSKVFALPWMTYLGKISYGIYLWHYPVLLILARVFDVRPLLIAVMALVGAIALASMSYQLLETPIRRGRVLDPYAWRVVAGGLALSVVSAVVVVGPILSSERRPSVVASTDSAGVEEIAGEWAERKVPADLDLESVSKDHGPNFRTCPDDPADCVVVDGEGPHVVLVGDSHARMAAESLTRIAEEQDLKLSMSIAGGCPWIDGLYNSGASTQGQDRCLAARDGFYDRLLPRMEPDVVLLVGFGRDDEKAWGDKIVPISGSSDQGLHERYVDGVPRTLDKIRETGARTIIVKSILGTGGWENDGFDPLDCLARAETLGECAVAPSLETPFVDGLYDAEATERDDVGTVDINPLFCPDAPLCRPVLDGQVVWRDDRHVASGVLTSLREEIWAEIRDTGLVPRR